MNNPKLNRELLLEQNISIPYKKILLEGELKIPYGAKGIVLFAHGSGSSRHSPRNQYVASIIRDSSIGTLLFDLLTHKEEEVDNFTAHIRFDIELLAQRLIETTKWVSSQEYTKNLSIGYFGASTGAASALVAAAELGEKISAVVSRGGRPDLASKSLLKVKSPTLLIIGSYDPQVIVLNQEAYQYLKCEKELKIISGASHLFEEPGKLEEVAQLATTWFKHYL